MFNKYVGYLLIMHAISKIEARVSSELMVSKREELQSVFEQ